MPLPTTRQAKSEDHEGPVGVHVERRQHVDDHHRPDHPGQARTVLRTGATPSDIGHDAARVAAEADAGQAGRDQCRPSRWSGRGRGEAAGGRRGDAGEEGATDEPPPPTTTSTKIGRPATRLNRSGEMRAELHAVEGAAHPAMPADSMKTPSRVPQQVQAEGGAGRLAVLHGQERRLKVVPGAPTEPGHARSHRGQHEPGRWLSNV